ncbi:MAG: hypothetical protein EOS20_10945 [Mesorhizobium sp.]|uniref:hypothetical protein n=1 Tax=Mesorhizobium sp. TaxID=1871066 RepID=UPI000FE53BEF|nr:hypothetical protein [Mesorhizobium sp.]RWQ37766.1 MAG: hypothetical protein EOS20_10945 [Mesorhizobium sp.]
MALSKLLSGRARTYRPGFLARMFPFGKWKLTLDPKLSWRIRLSQGGDVDLSCLDIVSISISKALLWHTVEIRARGRTDNLSGLSGDASEQLAANLHAFINTHLFDLIGTETDHLLDVDARLREITKATDSISRRPISAGPSPACPAALPPHFLTRFWIQN